MNLASYIALLVQIKGLTTLKPRYARHGISKHT
jgi:hypothetical protein